MSSRPNPSLQKRSAARMAAVQELYRLSMTGDAPDTPRQMASLKKEFSENRSEQKMRVGNAVEPNYPLLESILQGVGEWQAQIDARLDSVLDKDWKRDRMSPLLVAILQCAIFELFFHKDTAPKIVIDEYTRLTRSFFGDGEVNFVHGALSALSKKYHE